MTLVREWARGRFQSDAKLGRIVWAAIALLFAVGLGAAVVGSLRTPHPEVIIETCSFAVAILLVMAERSHARYGARVAAMRNVLDELVANATALFCGVWDEAPEAVIGQLPDKTGGLRIYYDHLAVSAVQAAILGGALESQTDAELVRTLHKWQHSADVCNARLSMAELHYFFLPRSDQGMLERLDIHLTIATDAVAKQRLELAELHALLVTMVETSRLPPAAVVEVSRIGSLLRTAPGLQRDVARLVALADDVAQQARRERRDDHARG